MNSLEMPELESRILNNRSVIWGRDGFYEEFEELLVLLPKLAEVWQNYSLVDKQIIDALVQVVTWLWGWTLNPKHRQVTPLKFDFKTNYLSNLNTKINLPGCVTQNDGEMIKLSRIN